MRIIRQVIDTKKMPYGKMLIEGAVVEDYVCPDTVKVYPVWENFSGKDMVGPDLVEDTPPNKRQKLVNGVAVRLTRILRKLDDCGDNF